MKGLRIHSYVAAFTVTASLALSAMPATARAEALKSGTFFEIGIGSAHDANELADGVEIGHTNYVKRAYLGYRFNEYLGFQVGYVDFATLKYNNTATGLNDQFDYDGVHGKVFGYLPFSRDSDGYYAIGISGGSWSWNSDVRSPSGNSRSKGRAPVVGAALLFSGRTSAVKLEAEQYQAEPLVLGTDFVTNGKVKTKYNLYSLNFLFYLQ